MCLTSRKVPGKYVLQPKHFCQKHEKYIISKKYNYTCESKAACEFSKQLIKIEAPQPREYEIRNLREKCYRQVCLMSREVPGKYVLRPKHFCFRILVQCRYYLVEIIKLQNYNYNFWRNHNKQTIPGMGEKAEVDT